MLNVLITSASRKVSLIKAFQKALILEDSGKVIAVDANSRSAALLFADDSFVAPRGLGNEFFEFILNLCIKEEIGLVVPTRDEELPVFAQKRELFESIGIAVMVPSQNTVINCQDKAKFARFCVKNYFSVPAILAADRIPHFPVFVRARRGKGSMSSFKCLNRPELDLLNGRFHQPLIQEYIDADEYTVDLYFTLSGIPISAVPRLRISTFGGESFIGRTSLHWPIIEESIRLGVELKLRGHNTVQCFDHDGRVKFIEVNPRFGGGANLGFAAGVLTPSYLIGEILGKTVKPGVGKFTSDLTMLRYTEDRFVMEAEHVGI